MLGASTTFHGLFSSYGFIELLPPPAARSGVPLTVKYDPVGSGYFQPVGARLLRGREFDARDSESGAKAIILDESLARNLFGHTDPIGATLRGGAGATYTIVGIVADMREASVRGRRAQEAYIPIAQTHQGGFWLAVRVRDPATAVHALRRAVLDADPSLPIEVHVLNDLVGESVAEDRLMMRVTVSFGIVALLLAGLGLYCVTSYATSLRTGEFGLGMALGAESGSVARLVLGESAVLGAIRLACGIPAGLAATRLIRTQIFGSAESTRHHWRPPSGSSSRRRWLRRISWPAARLGRRPWKRSGQSNPP